MRSGTSGQGGVWPPSHSPRYSCSDSERPRTQVRPTYRSGTTNRRSRRRRHSAPQTLRAPAPRVTLTRIATAGVPSTGVAAKVTPSYSRTATARVKSARLTVKRGTRTVVRNATSARLPVGTYRVTQTVTYVKAAKTRVSSSGKVTVLKWGTKVYTVRATQTLKVQVQKLRNLSAPTLSGGAEPGMTLRASAGIWNTPGVTLSYQWRIDGKPMIDWRTDPFYSNRFVPSYLDLGHRISVVVTAKKSGWAPASSTSSSLTIAPPKSAVQACPSAQYSDFAAGADFALALTTTGVVCGWGENTLGQLGTTTADYQAEPVQVHGVPAASQVSAGRQFGVALTLDGEVWSWGVNESCELGREDLAARRNVAEGVSPVLPISFVARKVPGLPRITSITATQGTTFAVAHDGTVYEWGNGVCAPKRLGGLSDVASVASNSATHLALTNSGKVLQWGNLIEGEDWVEYRSTHAQAVLPGQSFSDIAVSGSASYALSTTGRVFGWGLIYGLPWQSDEMMFPVPGDEMMFPVPSEYTALPTATSLDAAGELALVRLADGRVAGWGEALAFDAGSSPGDFRLTTDPLGTTGASVISSPSVDPETLSAGLWEGSWYGALNESGEYHYLRGDDPQQGSATDWPFRTDARTRGTIGTPRITILEARKSGCSTAFESEITRDVPIIITTTSDLGQSWSTPYTIEELRLVDVEYGPTWGGADNTCRSGAFTLTQTARSTSYWTWAPDGVSRTATKQKAWS